MKPPKVELQPLDDGLIDRLLEVAIADADPEEVMPPVTDEPGWTQRRRDAFRAFHRDRLDGLAGPHREVHFAVVSHGEVVGSARLALRSEPDALETGTWLARSKRNIGIGSALVETLLQTAARQGAAVMVAETTATNHAALVVLRRHGAVFEEGPEGRVRARIDVPPTGKSPDELHQDVGDGP